MKKAQIPLEIGYLPPKEYSVYISPIPECILGVDILQWSADEFRLRLYMVKAVLKGHAKQPPIALPVPQWVANTKQYKLHRDTRKLGKLYKS